jgi:hypothetical protein
MLISSASATDSTDLVIGAHWIEVVNIEAIALDEVARRKSIRTDGEAELPFYELVGLIDHGPVDDVVAGFRE